MSFFIDNLQKRLKDVGFDTMLEVLGDEKLSDKQKALIVAAYASNHREDATGFTASLLGFFMIS